LGECLRRDPWFADGIVVKVELWVSPQLAVGLIAALDLDDLAVGLVELLVQLYVVLPRSSHYKPSLKLRARYFRTLLISC